jgi:hypothetical protein
VWVGFVALLEATNSTRPCRIALLEKEQIEERPKCRREGMPLHDRPLSLEASVVVVVEWMSCS